MLEVCDVSYRAPLCAPNQGTGAAECQVDARNPRTYPNRKRLMARVRLAALAAPLMLILAAAGLQAGAAEAAASGTWSATGAERGSGRRHRHGAAVHRRRAAARRRRRVRYVARAGSFAG